MLKLNHKICTLTAILCLLSIWTLAIEAREIRYNRFGKLTAENGNPNERSEVKAVVREVKEAPYPAAGYRPPGRAFNIPGEVVDDDSEVIEGSGTASTTTETASVLSTTMSTTADDTTIISNLSADSLEKSDKAPYPPSGFRPDRAFPLPTENQTTLSANETVKAPYPPAGYKPSRIFLLPTELQQGLDSSASDSLEYRQFAELTEGTTTESSLEETTVADPNAPTKTTEVPLAPFTPTASSSSSEPEPTPSPSPAPKKPSRTPDNSKHPVCGVSLNPLKPTPPPGSKDDPDAERVFINDGHAVIIEADGEASSPPMPMPKPVPVPAAIPALGTTIVQFQGPPQTLLAQPLFIARPPISGSIIAAPSSSFAYSTQVQSW